MYYYQKNKDYLERSRYLMVSLTDINGRLAPEIPTSKFSGVLNTMVQISKL